MRNVDRLVFYSAILAVLRRAHQKPNFWPGYDAFCGLSWWQKVIFLIKSYLKPQQDTKIVVIKGGCYWSINPAMTRLKEVNFSKHSFVSKIFGLVVWKLCCISPFCQNIWFHNRKVSIDYWFCIKICI